MPPHTRITPFLWFDTQAEEAARYYCSIFPNSRITRITRYGEAGREHHRREPGTVMLVYFELDGQSMAALNGGPIFQFNEAVSLAVNCETQAEVDHYWDALSAGGDPKAQVCGWLKDRFGVSWQVNPTVSEQLLGDHTSPRSQAAMAAAMKMTKPDIAAMQAAYDAGS